MPRPRREWYPGAFYHVMSRGNRRLVLYNDEDDFISFLELILETREKYQFMVHSLCLMSNHFHMALETKDVELWKIMKRMLHPYSVNFNKKYNYTGHLFENRYTSCLIEDERYFLEVSRYIHLNPVKARIVRDPLDYTYSSYGLFVNRTKGAEEIIDRKKAKIKEMISEIVETDRVLSAFQPDPHEQYRMFVEGANSHTEEESQIQKDMKEDDKWIPC